MTLNEKLDNSVIISMKEVNNSAYGIKPKQKRIKKYIFFILIAAYTILSKFIFKKITDWDVSYLFLAINLVCLCIITVLDGHQRKYNHLVLYKTTFFISKVCKTIIFVFAFLVAYKFFDAFYEEILGEHFWNFYGNTFFKGDFDAYFNAHGISHGGDYITVSGTRMQYSDVQIKLVLFWVSIIMAVPSVMFLFLFNLGIFGKIITFLLILAIPIVNIIWFFKWFFSTNVTFLHYVPKEGSDNITIIEKREIVKGRTELRLKQIFIHLLIVLTIVGSGWIAYMSVSNLFKFN